MIIDASAPKKMVAKHIWQAVNRTAPSGGGAAVWRMQPRERAGADIDEAQRRA